MIAGTELIAGVEAGFRLGLVEPCILGSQQSYCTKYEYRDMIYGKVSRVTVGMSPHQASIT